ncbi:hypothetical protein M758_3G162300 [Ceratodon purpureus]|nr:hypothetical protein M758_3G162300 [Ceratodon purpureus]
MPQTLKKKRPSLEINAGITHVYIIHVAISTASKSFQHWWVSTVATSRWPKQSLQVFRDPMLKNRSLPIVKHQRARRIRAVYFPCGLIFMTTESKTLSLSDKCGPFPHL